MITKDNAAQYIPLLQAVAEGKTLQAKSGAGNWVTLKGLYLLDEPDAYRVKPEPRVITVWEHSGCGRKVVEEGLPDTSKAYAGVHPAWKATVFREVEE